MKCANLEQLSVVIRFVDGDKQIREEFLDFITVERITGDSIFAALLSWLQAHELDVAYCRGQGYDGASSISGVSSEVLRVLEHPPQLLASFFSRLASIVIYPII